MIREWLRHLFDPHCPVCETRVKCETCEDLREQLSIANRYNQQLLDRLCVLPESQVQVPQQPFEPVKQFENWRVRRAKLEADSRVEAKRIKDEREAQSRLAEELKVRAPKSIDELEEELGIENAQSGTS